MNILILHQHFNIPLYGGALRSYYLAKALIDSGINPIVITATSDTIYRKQNYEGIEIHYLPVAYDNRFGFWKRSFSFLRYGWMASRLAANIPEIKICYAISVPLTVGISARLIKFRSNIPYIFEVGDLWPDAPIQMGFVKNRFLIRVLYELEKSIYNNALSVVALSTVIKSAIEQKSPLQRVHVIPNMSDTDFYKPAAKEKALEKKFGVEGKFVISYIGAFGLANDLDLLLQNAFESQQAELPVFFLLCGDGAMVDKLKEKQKEYDLRNLKFIPFQNRIGVREVMNVTDATFISYKSIPILETGSPNKYFDGLASGKLILINFGGWIKEEIETHRCGVFIDPRSPNDFAKKIQPFIDSPELLHQYQQSSRTLAESVYSRKVLGEKFRDLFLERTER